MIQNSLPRLGVHVSIAKGLHLAFDRAQILGCQTIQIFLRNSNQWRVPPLSPSDIAAFKNKQLQSGIFPVFAHEIYLINLGSSVDLLYEKSNEALWQDMQRAESLGIPYLVLHPGAHTGGGVEEGLRRISDALNRQLEKAAGFKLELLLEITAGQGTVLGRNFEQLAQIIDKIERKDRIGICLDTAHAYAAGYDLKSEEGYRKTWIDFDKIFGINRLKLIHLNDSKRELGSNIDRHEHIGQGFLGLETFRRLLNDSNLKSVSMILETPKEFNVSSENMDEINLRVLRSLKEGGWASLEPPYIL